MSTSNKHIRIGGVLYTHETTHRSILGDFANEIARRGWKIGGVVQELLFDDKGERIGVDAVEVDTGTRYPISRPTEESKVSKTCTLDRAALTDATTPLRNALNNEVDLMVVEKFGEQEREGSGLADDILSAVADGIPTLVAVPASEVEKWNEFSGYMGDLLPSNIQDLWRWWGPHKLYRELANSVIDAPVKRVVLGLNWTLVEGPNGCGLAQSPSKDTPGCKSLPHAGSFAGNSLRELAELATSWNPFETAIGIAAVNAHWNRYDLKGSDENGLDSLKGVDGPIAVVGRFPGISERLPGANVIERSPQDGEYPEQAAENLIGESEGAIITASTLVNRSLPNLLSAGRNTKICLVGPGTPLAPDLHVHGIDTLSGLVITDPDGAAQAVAEGGGAKALKKFGNFVTLKEPISTSSF
ncbi:MAG: DUF2478 domain-containing protein [Rhodospirillales bacterium]|nr:DUF2478 domain-containing protein [Rhodospirillales bacterium]